MPSAGSNIAENHVLQHRLQQSKGQRKLVDWMQKSQAQSRSCPGPSLQTSMLDSSLIYSDSHISNKRMLQTTSEHLSVVRCYADFGLLMRVHFCIEMFCQPCTDVGGQHPNK